MSAKTKENQDVDEKEAHCFACGNELRNYSILICAECLDEECGEFMKLAQNVDSRK